MNDFVFLAITVAFFALALLFVKACDRIIGADEEVSEAPAEGPSQESVAA